MVFLPVISCWTCPPSPTGARGPAEGKTVSSRFLACCADGSVVRCKVGVRVPNDNLQIGENVRRYHGCDSQERATRWQGNRESENVEDVRGSGAAASHRGRQHRARHGRHRAARGLDLRDQSIGAARCASGGGGAPAVQQVPAAKPPADDQMARFVSVVLADTEDVWTRAVPADRAARTASRSSCCSAARAQSACGMASAASGRSTARPTRRSTSTSASIDELRARFGAPGDFAQAYVIAHEVGHHVQNLLGIVGKVDATRSARRRGQANALSVRLELQADCFAGVWAHHAQRRARSSRPATSRRRLNAAAADRRRHAAARARRARRARDRSRTARRAQRVSWFKRGLQSGDMRQCDTFEARQL